MISVAVCVPNGYEPATGVLEALGADATVVQADTIWQARNRALAECSTEILAFVDGDVVVADDWRERLGAAWSQASQEIAAIGGPVRGGGRGVADSIDLGPEAVDLDPRDQTLLAANLSFRCAALTGVGGFGAPVDHRDARDWFAEEHEAQRQLGHWGWLVRYDPALSAERADGWPGAPRAGRFRYGLRIGITRRRAAREAIRAAATSGAGTVVAAAQPELRRERAARAAENLGVLLAPLAAPRAYRRGAPAAGAPQPRRGSAPDRRRRSDRALAPVVLLYHRVALADQDPLRLCVTPEHFREQMAVVADSAQVIAMDELAQAHRDGSLPTGVIAITFDDGYRDNIDALGDLGLPVTLFAATGHVASGIPFFWDEAAALLLRPGARPPRLDVTTEAGSLSLPTRTEAQRRSAVSAFHGLVQRQPADAIETALAQLRAWAGWAPEPRDAATRLMTPDELAGLARSGVTIGAHTRNHVNLAHQTAQVVRSEIEGSREDVAAWTGRQPAGFSYPFGIPRQDVDATARDAVEAGGFAYAVVNQPVPVAPGHDRFRLPRIVAPDLGADAFRAWLASQTRSRAQTAPQ